MSIKKKIERLLPKPMLQYYIKWKTHKHVAAWEQAGAPHFTLEERSHTENQHGVIGVDLPATKEIKNRVIRSFRQRFDTPVFIETGTFLGDMVEEQRGEFDKLYSIEVNEALWKKAQQRFQEHGHIQLLCGDSGRVLQELMPKINSPSLLWLDGHYSGGITGRGLLNTPIRKELQAIADSPYAHVVLIDDARLFNGEEDYPTMEALQELSGELFPEYGFLVEDDIIQIYPSKG